MIGTIDYLKTDKRFGFIRQEGAKDHRNGIFFHSSQLEDITFDELTVGTRVEFETQESPRGKGTEAINVRLAD